MTHQIVLWDLKDPKDPTIQNMWVNFCSLLGMDITVNNLNQKLAEFKAKYIWDDRRIYIEFEDEQNLSLFILRYS